MFVPNNNFQYLTLYSAYRELEEACNIHLSTLESDEEEVENCNIYIENAYRDQCRIRTAIAKRSNPRGFSGRLPNTEQGDINTIRSSSCVSVGNKVQFLIEPPKFSGDIRRYPTFVKDYEKYMAVTYGRDAYALRTCLAGKAADVAAGCDDNYEEIWRRLDAYFLNPERAVNAVMSEMRGLKPLKENDTLGFLEMVDVVERGWRDLCKLKLRRDMDADAILNLLGRVVPRRHVKKWLAEPKKAGDEGNGGEGAGGKGTGPGWLKFQSFLKYLQRERELYEYMQFHGTSV